MRLVTDMMGNKIRIPSSPKRIISLVPSLTELLYDLDLEEEVVGITKFCIRPKHWFEGKTRIGGTKTLNFEKIKALAPDLIIANKEENTKEEIEKLMDAYPVWLSDINTYKEAITAINLIGLLCNREERATQLVQQIEIKKANYSKPIGKPKKVLYLIWKDPYMAVGQSTYINDIIATLGYVNCYKEERYKTVTIEEIKELKPDYILLSSEPYPFKEKHIEEFKQFIPNSPPKIVDGELFSWYGSRLFKLFDGNLFL